MSNNRILILRIIIPYDIEEDAFQTAPHTYGSRLLALVIITML